MHSFWPQSATFKDSSDLEFDEYQRKIKEPIALDVIKERLYKTNRDQVKNSSNKHK